MPYKPGRVVPWSIMGTFDANPGSTELCKGVPITAYRKMVKEQDRAGIAKLIRDRFRERYLDAVATSARPHGFSMLAIGCLMVEALESFRLGLPTTDRRSEAVFCSFFQAHDEFAELRPLAHDFYRSVRCGILHQAETVNAWRVNQDATLLQEEKGTRWISGCQFLDGLRTVLDRYCQRLDATDWNDPLWLKARKKLSSICKNCGVKDLSGLA